MDLRSNVSEEDREGARYSRLAKRGAAGQDASGTGTPSRASSAVPAYTADYMDDVRRTIEASYDYWSGKMFTLVHEPMAMLQVIQDELGMHFTNVPRDSDCSSSSSTPAPGAAPAPAHQHHHQHQQWPDLSHRPTLYLNAMLRVLQYNITQYVFWLEMKDALNRLEGAQLQQHRRRREKRMVSTQESTAEQQQQQQQQEKKQEEEKQEEQEEIEWIRRLATLSEEEAALNARLLYAGSAGKGYLTASFAQTPDVDVTKDLIRAIRFAPTLPLSEMNMTKLDRASAALFLRPDELALGGLEEVPSVYERFLVFEQACEAEPEAEPETALKSRYPYALQLALGEYSLPLNLLIDLPLARTFESQSTSAPSPTPTLTKSLAVRLNIAQTAVAEICTMLPDIGIFCDPRRRRDAMGLCEPFWDAVRAAVGIMLERFDVPQDVRGKVLPFFHQDQDESEAARWERVPPKEEDAHGHKTDELESGVRGSVSKQIWQVSSKEMDLWRKVFEEDGQGVAKVDDVVQLFRSIDFKVEKLGGSFIRFAPPNQAGTAWILRAPAPGAKETTIPLRSVGHNLTYMYGWDISWFARKKEEEEGESD